jgi:two-component system alkaline phosphatase synthesis response regulator PhoP
VPRGIVAVAIREVPDVILLDGMMPGVDGIEVIRVLPADERTRAIPTHAVSALGSADSIARLLEAGANGYVTKTPNMGRQIADVITKLAAEHRESHERG